MRRRRQQLAPHAPGAELQQLQAEHIVEGRASSCASAWISARPEGLTLPLLQYGERIGHDMRACYVDCDRLLEKR